ncbi:MAG: branched-chain amino acid ABC transporter permease [Thermodesulfobacteriota bacterium]
MSQEPTPWKSIVVGTAVLVGLVCCPWFLSRFYVYLVALILVTGLLATSLNMVLGLGGMFQFHHAVFYGMGAYTFALMLTKSGLPSWCAFVAAPICAALLGLAIGVICVRTTKLYFGMIQLSLGSLVWALVFRWYSFTGGDDGIHGVPVPSFVASGKGSFYFTLVVCGICLFVMHRIVQSPFGRVFQGIRDNSERSEGIGIDVRRHQLVGELIATFFAGVAGVLFVVVEGSVFPELMNWHLSLEILIMCLLGGWFTFLGPMLGAAIIVVLRTVVGVYTEYWTSFLAIILMLLIFFLPEGVLGYFLRAPKSRDGRARPEAE